MKGGFAPLHLSSLSPPSFPPLSSVRQHTPLSTQLALPRASLQPGPTHQLQIEPKGTENSSSSLLAQNF